MVKNGQSFIINLRKNSLESIITTSHTSLLIETIREHAVAVQNIFSAQNAPFFILMFRDCVYLPFIPDDVASKTTSKLD